MSLSVSKRRKARQRINRFIDLVSIQPSRRTTAQDNEYWRLVERIRKDYTGVDFSTLPYDEAYAAQLAINEERPVKTSPSGRSSKFGPTIVCPPDANLVLTDIHIGPKELESKPCIFQTREGYLV